MEDMFPRYFCKIKQDDIEIEFVENTDEYQEGAFVDHIEKSDEILRLTHALRLLGCKERFVLSGMAGLGGRSYTLTELSGFLGITKERVRQIGIIALRKTKRRMSA